MQLSRIFKSSIVLSLIIGIIGGLVGIGFLETITYGQQLLLGFSDSVFNPETQFNPWRIMIVPTLGGALLGLFYYWFVTEKRAEGVADVMVAGNNLAKADKESKTQKMGFKAFFEQVPVHVLSLSCGASCGRKGPVIYLIACLSSGIASLFHVSPDKRRLMLGSGVAAAIAASFNAPLAGVFFALEVVIGEYALASFTPLVISSAVATMITREYYGDQFLFNLDAHATISYLELPAITLLGIICGVGAHFLIIAIRLVQKSHIRFHIPFMVRPMLGGLCVGVIGVYFPQILGVGYGATNAILSNQVELIFLALLIIAKGFATAMTLGSGFGGGIFSPSLVLGALMGALFGGIAGMVVPDYASPPSAYALVGMGAMTGAVLGAPISTILILFELTGDLKTTLAVMLATVISSQYLMWVHGLSFFTTQLQHFGFSGISGFTLFDQDNTQKISPKRN